MMTDDDELPTSHTGDSQDKNKKRPRKRKPKNKRMQGVSDPQPEGPFEVHHAGPEVEPQSDPLSLSGAGGEQNPGKPAGAEEQSLDQVSVLVGAESKDGDKLTQIDPQPSTSSESSLSSPIAKIDVELEVLSLGSPYSPASSSSTTGPTLKPAKLQSPQNTRIPDMGAKDGKQGGKRTRSKKKVTQREKIDEGPEVKETSSSSPASSSVESASKSPKEAKVPEGAQKIGLAFLKEDELDSEAKNKKKKSRNSAEDAFAELTQLIGIEFKQKSEKALCLRPNFKGGTEGLKVRVKTNFFKLNVRGTTVYQYDVSFLKSDESAAVAEEQEIGRRFKRLTKRMNQRLLSTFVETTGAGLFHGISYAYDNERILLTSRPILNLPGGGEIFSFNFRETEEGDSKVETIFVRILATNSATLHFNPNISSGNNVLTQNRSILQMIDIITKDHAFKHDIIYGTKIFLPAGREKREPMSGRNSTPYEIAFGYHQSTQLCQGGIMQNIDRATAVFYKGGPLIKTISELLNIVIDQHTTIDPQCLRELTLLRIETDYRGFPSRHSIRSFTRTPANETFFSDERYGRVSVVEYFTKQYPPFQCKYPRLPCVEYARGRYIPIELCYLMPDQRNQRKLRDELIRIVSKHTTSQKPFQRSNAIGETALNISQQLLGNEFTIEVSPKQIIVQSRVLDSPKLTYKNTQALALDYNGSWDMRGQTMLSSTAVRNWACITLSRRIDVQIANRFIAQLVSNARTLGMTMESTSAKSFPSNRLESTFKELASKRPQLILVIMMENSETYSKVKSLGDKLYGIPTQVVLDKHYDPRQKQRQKLFETSYICNLLLKINMKVGGTNLKLNESHRCSILNEKTMVVGIDVNHPSPGENAPSIAAVVGSIDEDFAQYRTEIRVNDSREEIVRVDEMIDPILETFKSKRKFYPEHIIVYRDGVSEGQFASVMAREILPLHYKLESLPGKKPELTYMIVQKRHNARFFPMNPKEATFKGNILPGSVIDTDICHYKWFDFYLCSQNSILGTARPGKYTVLWHSNQASADELQKATYYLCYLFARATKSIADPAPARYAHHAAARGKVHLRSMPPVGPNNQREINMELSRAINVADSLKQILYFI